MNGSVKRDTKNHHIQLRSELYRVIRDFFYSNNFIEVETPLLIKTPALEDHIDAIPCGDKYLRTSPELHMKRLIQADCERIFQIGSCFRKGESGKLHHPEFSMLEWYVTGYDYNQIMTQSQSLIRYIIQQLTGSHVITYQNYTIDFNASWDVFTIDDIFQKYANISALQALKDNIFESILIEKIEPELCLSQPVFLIDYPIEIGALARAKPSNPLVAERWELYAGGVELANAYSELIDVNIQLERFKKCAEFRNRNDQEVYPLDLAFLDALAKGMPECAGCALGLDRLLMLITNSGSINDVLAFH